MLDYKNRRRAGGTVMALILYGFHAYPSDFAATKAGAPIEECPFLLDFTSPLRTIRWMGSLNYRVGPFVALLVPSSPRPK